METERGGVSKSRLTFSFIEDEVLSHLSQFRTMEAFKKHHQGKMRGSYEGMRVGTTFTKKIHSFLIVPCESRRSIIKTKN